MIYLKYLAKGKKPLSVIAFERIMFCENRSENQNTGKAVRTFIGIFVFMAVSVVLIITKLAQLLIMSKYYICKKGDRSIAKFA